MTINENLAPKLIKQKNELLQEIEVLRKVAGTEIVIKEKEERIVSLEQDIDELTRQTVKKAEAKTKTLGAPEEETKMPKEKKVKSTAPKSTTKSDKAGKGARVEEVRKLLAKKPDMTNKELVEKTGINPSYIGRVVAKARCK